LIKRQTAEIQTALAPLTTKQRALLLEQYVDLLLRSAFTLAMEVKPDELKQFLLARFPHYDEGAEAKEKRGKRAQVYSDEIEEELSRLVAAFQGRFRENLLEVTLTCDRNDYEFPFEIAETEDGYHLVLSGVHVPRNKTDSTDVHHYAGGDIHCLELSMKEREAAATLSWIGTRIAACPIPKDKAALCLLSVAEQLAKAAGKEALLLEDASQIQCTSSRRETSLQHLKFYQEGKSWYEKYGYKVFAEPAYPIQIHKFRTYELSSLVANVLHAETGEYRSNEKDLLISEAKKFAALNKGKTVSDFMSWLWNEDCNKYIDVDSFIFDKLLEFDFANLYPEISLFRKAL